jgi:hypothetical protein
MTSSAASQMIEELASEVVCMASGSVIGQHRRIPMPPAGLIGFSIGNRHVTSVAGFGRVDDSEFYGVREEVVPVRPPIRNPLLLLRVSGCGKRSRRNVKCYLTRGTEKPEYQTCSSAIGARR